jgi:endonuclease YncB( thermonuclease family)
MSEHKQASPRAGSHLRGAEKFIWPAIGLVLAACIVIASVQARAQPAAAAITGRATVRDGDSIRIGEQRVVLWGIDAPGRKSVCGDVRVGREARNALREIVGRRQVTCTVRETDRHGRAVSVCQMRGRDLGALMVEQGWARDWPRLSCGAYANGEASARQARRGVWAMECPALWGNRNYFPDRCRQPTQPQ